MKHFCDRWIENWCQENGWTELSLLPTNQYWAFPPGAVMPEPIPTQTLHLIKSQNGLCPEEKKWLGMATILSLIAIGLSYYFHSPMPIVVAFAFDAITAAQLEVEDL